MSIPSKKASPSQQQTIEQFLNAVKQKESNNNYEAQHPKSGGTGSGAYGFVDEIWKRVGGETTCAMEATKENQDEVAKKYANDLYIKYQGDTEKMAQAWNCSETLVDMQQVPPEGLDYAKDILKRIESESKFQHKARYQFHNPGNLKAGESWQGLAGVESTPRGDLCRFETLNDGLRAMAATIYRYGSRDKINTVKSLIKVYHSDLEESKIEEETKFIETKMKLERDSEIALTDPSILQKFMSIMIEYETSQEPPSQEEIGKAIQGIKGVENL